ncbi:putative protoplast regeneration and killer toxin resistance protein [Erysiphe necator]|uniref:Putative protoplast regeneration and killer toxin resistance protein n=1 Tax=Uncinula necator TaxID=52586 RepID=A0A0B1NY56_UNCNE|nr:putative protoplast regeneration and killer toxin resistance protein [Erysiphe necator]
MATIPSTPVMRDSISYKSFHNQESGVESLQSRADLNFEEEKITRQAWLHEISKDTFVNDHEQKIKVTQKTKIKPVQNNRLEEVSTLVIQDAPFRPLPSVITNNQSQRVQPQSVIMSSGNSSDSIRSSSGSSASVDLRHSRTDSDQPEEDQHYLPDEVAQVPPFQYYHQKISSDNLNTNPTPYISAIELGQSTNRYLTPTLNSKARNYSQRPISTYSDLGPRRKSPGSQQSQSPRSASRVISNNSGHKFHDGRPKSCIDLSNTSYPQPPPPPISLDNSQLRSVVGSNASLLSTSKTIEMYRQNLKKLNDSETQYAFAIYLLQAAQEHNLNQETDTATKKKHASNCEGRNQVYQNFEQPSSSSQDLIQEAKHILQRLANQSYPYAQYYLADGYASGLFNKGKEDYSTAFPLFVAASKHGHAESGYRAALCYEFGWGCRKDPAKAVQFFRQSASKNHPGAMTRLGQACLSGDLGLNKYREGVKWLKRATESADLQYNAAPYHLGLLFETGYGDDIFRDETYAAQLFTQAADLGHSEASFRLGEAYELGNLCCPRDPALSVHFYTNAAQSGHAGAMMALCAWYIVGAEPILEKDENEAYEWARQAAACGLAKAQYAVGYFTEVGIGTRPDPLEANVWFVKAAEAGDERAKLRLSAIRAATSEGKTDTLQTRSSGKIRKSQSGAESANPSETCTIM